MATVPSHLSAVPDTVEHLVTHMASLADTLPASDGVAVFNRLYLSVTRELRRRLTPQLPCVA